METTCGIGLLVFLSLLSGTVICSSEFQGCQRCVHITMEINNIPLLYKSLLESTLSRYQTINQDCVHGRSQVETCPVLSTTGGLSERKCQAINMTTTAHGLGTVFPDAVMVTIVTMRDCIDVEGHMEDTCTSLETAGGDSVQYLLQAVDIFRQQWNNGTIQGDMCLTSPMSTASDLP